LDDFHALQLDKMDRFVCLKKIEVVIGEDEESTSDDETDSDSQCDEDAHEGGGINDGDENDVPSDVKPAACVLLQSQDETQPKNVGYHHHLTCH